MLGPTSSAQWLKLLFALLVEGIPSGGHNQAELPCDSDLLRAAAKVFLGEAPLVGR